MTVHKQKKYTTGLTHYHIFFAWKATSPSTIASISGSIMLTSNENIILTTPGNKYLYKSLHQRLTCTKP